jgi:hypothetical protein
VDEITILKKLNCYPTLKKFLGDEWFIETITSSRPKKHPLYQLNDPFMLAILQNLNNDLEIVLHVIEEDPEKVEKRKRLEGKIKNIDEFYDVLSEIEWASYFKNMGFPVSIEPTLPSEGPDLKVRINDRDIYFEIKSLHLSAEDRKEDKLRNEIIDRIKKVQSRFLVAFSLNEAFSNKELFLLIKLIKKKIKEFEKENALQPISIYYFSRYKIRELYGYDGLNPLKDTHTLFSDRRRAKAEIIFYPQKDYFGDTRVWSIGNVKVRNDVERIRRALSEKSKQLKLDDPAVVVIDISNTLFIDEFDVMDAIYGMTECKILMDKDSGKIVDTYWSKKKDGTYQVIKRISAVVLYKRKVSDAGVIEFERKIYTNPNAKNPLNKEEISKIGELVTPKR